MKQNIMMRRMLSRLLVTFFFLLSFVTLSAQTGGTQPQVLSSVLKTLPADKFEFNRQLKDFSVVGSTLHCYLSMPRNEWTDMLATVSSEYTVDDFSSMYDPQRSATLARLSNEKNMRRLVVHLSTEGLRCSGMGQSSLAMSTGQGIYERARVEHQMSCVRRQDKRSALHL